ncbi:hypothetical protein [Facilibium subflavum]|uniref:hypothetical protein n=1 Tax=Facilibium subflavum TaxID=2219058 RepID=UPI0013C2A1C8|nr:hypothetical protein [Facilibium subflavum]
MSRITQKQYEAIKQQSLYAKRHEVTAKAATKKSTYYWLSTLCIISFLSLLIMHI